MSTAVLDSEKRITLTTLDQMMEIKKSDGQVVGRYVPEAEYKKLLYAWVESQSPLSKEALKQRSQEKGVHTLQEIWKRLGQQ
jgi:hypothetical protein